MNTNLEKRGHSVAEVAGAYGVSKVTIYSEINSGRLRSLKAGRRRIITDDALRDWERAREREASGVAA